MKIKVDNIDHLLKKLSYISWDKYDKQNLYAPGWKLYLRHYIGTITGNQLIVQLYYMNNLIYTWGCINGDNDKVVEWFLVQKHEIDKVNDQEHSVLYNQGVELFAAL
jgi:hypothetical protein